MFLTSRSSVLALFLAMSMASAIAAEPQCAKINCDCKVFGEANFREDCAAQERKIQTGCKSNGGTIQSYCGLHGPAAFPVATSLQSQSLTLTSPESANLILKQADTQKWSTAETFTAFEGVIKLNDYAKALPLANLIDSDASKLYAFQKQAVNALINENKAAEAFQTAQNFASVDADKADSLAQLSEQLWQRIPQTADDAQRKSLQGLSFKLARTAAAVYEYSGDVYADARQPEKSAKFWQQAAVIAQRLIAWESATGNDAQKLKYYQSQAAARWNRATYYWLESKNLEEMIISRKNGQSSAAGN